VTSFRISSALVGISWASLFSLCLTPPPGPQRSLISRLAESRAAALGNLPLPVNHDRRSESRNAVHVEPQAARHHLRIGEHIGDIVDRARPECPPLRALRQRFAAVAAQSFLQQRDQHGAIDHAVRICAEALILRQLRLPDDLAEASELAVIADRDDHFAVGHLERLVRHQIGVAVPHSARHLARDHPAQRLVAEHRDLAVEQRHVDMSPTAAPVPLPKRRKDRYRRIEAGEEVGIGDAGLLRLAVRLAGQRHRAAHALDDEIVSGS
jgi:hypothetical protein